MKTYNVLTLSTFPQTQPARKFRNSADLDRRQRLLYGRTLRYNTGKEPDPETGLYYFGARYLDPKTSRWLSGDPAIGEYVPSAPVSEEARKRNGSLPGMGGVFNYVNLHVYHYGGNNPVRYTDPDGRKANDDGTHTVEKDETLWGIYGADWQEKSGYTGDPRKLQIGEVVGKKNSAITEDFNTNFNNILQIPTTEQQNNSSRGKNIAIGTGEMLIGIGVVVGSVALTIVSEGSAIGIAYPLAMSGVTLFAFGFGRTFGEHDKPVTNDLKYMIPEPISTYGHIYDHLKEKQ